MRSGLLCLSLLAALLIPATAVAVDLAPEEVEEVTRINQYRQDNGLPKLTIDLKLTKAADWMSTDMAVNDRFSHTDSLGRDPFARLDAFGFPSNTWRGENLAAGNEGAEATFEQWRNSPGHNKNMLHPEYRSIGISRVVLDTSTYRYYWTTTFGSEVTTPVRPDGTFTTTTASTTPAATPSARTAVASRRTVARCKKLSRRSARYRKLRCGRVLAQERRRKRAAAALRG